MSKGLKEVREANEVLYILEKAFSNLYDVHLTNRQVNVLYKCISVLQQENERLNELGTHQVQELYHIKHFLNQEDRLLKTLKIKVTELLKKRDRLKREKRKAIEFIKENAGYDEEIRSCCSDLSYSDCDKLIELLGDGKDE